MLQKPSDNDVSTAGSRKGLFYGGCRGVLYAFRAVGRRGGRRTLSLYYGCTSRCQPASDGNALKSEALTRHRARSSKGPARYDPP